jgi:hypothetical protein
MPRQGRKFKNNQAPVLQDRAIILFFLFFFFRHFQIARSIRCTALTHIGRKAFGHSCVFEENESRRILLDDGPVCIYAAKSPCGKTSIVEGK